MSWEVEPHDVAPELEPDYPAEPYTPQPTHTERMTGIPLMDRLDEVMRTRLLDMAKETL